MTLTLTPAAGDPGYRALQAGKAAGPAGATEPVKLSSNENPFGPSPKAIEAYQRAAFA